MDAAKHQENITNYSFLQTVPYTGIRRGEAFHLQWKNIENIYRKWCRETMLSFEYKFKDDSFVFIISNWKILLQTTVKYMLADIRLLKKTGLPLVIIHGL
ncbi:hypothetical protein [Psychrobacillus sp. FJAT-51614]|uniref:hypothetical protein n=1 Tax=Psychrobacillus mangrovi TaxID=3117745 RepID=UPI0030134809